jgi:hypothetical protein
MQTMTWTSPDTGVVDRPGEAPLVQEDLHLNSMVSLCPAPSRARTRVRPKGVITLRGPFATRSLAQVSGIRSSARPDRRRGIVPAQTHAHGIVTAAGKCFRSVTNWIHLGDISIPTCRLPSCGCQVTERNVYRTVQCRPRRPPLTGPPRLALIH